MIKLYSVKVRVSLAHPILSKAIRRSVTISILSQEKQKKQAEQAAKGNSTTQSPAELRTQKGTSILT